MKRVIISNDSNEREFKIYAGVKIGKRENVFFNWRYDDPDDVVSLCKDTSGEFDTNNVRFVYGYMYNENASEVDIAVFRRFIKHVERIPKSQTWDFEKFVEYGILRFDERYNLSQFSATVHVEPSRSPSLTETMGDYIFEHMRKSKHFSLTMIKEAYENVKFDAEKAAESMREADIPEEIIQRSLRRTIHRFNDLKESGELFQMKNFTPRALRTGFTDFLKFKTEEERKTYESLQGVNVLIYDDLYTSGSTVNEAIRYLRSIHDQNKITVFVLVKQ